MKKVTFGLIASATLVGLAGCAAWLERQGQPAACVATYVKIAPAVNLGVDGCGNSWLKFEQDSLEACFYLSADGDSLIEMPFCPAEGETLAVSVK